MNTAPDTVDPANAHELVSNGAAVIVDVRDASAYAERHIAGALSIPIDQLAARRSELPVGVRVLTACGGGTRAGRAATQLRELGVEADIVKGGLRGWTTADLPVD